MAVVVGDGDGDGVGLGDTSGVGDGLAEGGDAVPAGDPHAERRRSRLIVSTGQRIVWRHRSRAAITMRRGGRTTRATGTRPPPVGMPLAPGRGMYAQLRLRVWIVESRADDWRDEGLSALPEVEILDEAAFRQALDAGDRPDALLIDHETVDRLDGHRVALDGLLRTVVVTDRPTDELPSPYLDRPGIRILRRPVEPGVLSRALLWLSGVEEDGWATAASR